MKKFFFIIFFLVLSSVITRFVPDCAYNIIIFTGTSLSSILAPVARQYVFSVELLLVACSSHVRELLFSNKLLCLFVVSYSRHPHNGD